MSDNKNIELEVHVPTFIGTSLICTMMTGAVFLSWSMVDAGSNNNQAVDIIRTELKRIGCVPSRPVHVTLEATPKGKILFNASCQMHVPGNKTPWPKPATRKFTKKTTRKFTKKTTRKSTKIRKKGK